MFGKTNLGKALQGYEIDFGGNRQINNLADEIIHLRANQYAHKQ